jgi:hypothetical protein
MRDYNSVSGLRPGQPDHDEEEPELQWLEDSINYLVAITFICIGAICTAVARGVVRAYEGYMNSKK